MKMGSETPTSGGSVELTVVGGTGFKRWNGTSDLAIAVGPPVVGIPHAAHATSASMAAPARSRALPPP